MKPPTPKTGKGEVRVMTPEQVNEFVRSSIVKAAANRASSPAHLAVTFNPKPKRTRQKHSPVDTGAISNEENSVPGETRGPHSQARQVSRERIRLSSEKKTKSKKTM